MRRTHRLAEWLGSNGHDAVEAQTLGPNPGDRALVELTEWENQVLVTMDKDLREFIYLRRVCLTGVIRLPDVRRWPCESK